MESSLPDASSQVPISEISVPEVSIIVPARNEEVSLGACLQSLTAQTGVAFEIIVVDDASTDRTREIAESFAGVRVISAGPLLASWTGKNNAMFAGAREASGKWLSVYGRRHGACVGLFGAGVGGGKAEQGGSCCRILPNRSRSRSGRWQFCR